MGRIAGLLVQFRNTSALRHERYLYSAHQSVAHETALITDYQVIGENIQKPGFILFL
jgi:hypothetical protein